MTTEQKDADSGAVAGPVDWPVGRAAQPWVGGRMNSTVKWPPRGRRARKAKFAARARKMRRWLAKYKGEMLASGRYFLPPQSMHDLYGDGSKHLACSGCGMCAHCGDCVCAPNR